MKIYIIKTEPHKIEILTQKQYDYLLHQISDIGNLDPCDILFKGDVHKFSIFKSNYTLEN